MASVPVDFLLNNLKQLITYHLNLISGAENEFQQLQNELRSLKAVLQDASSKRTKDECFKEWERQIRDVVHDVEDTIDTRIIQMWIEKDMNLAQRKMAQARRISLAKLVKSLREDKVKPLLEDSRINLAKLSLADVPDTSAEETRDIRNQKRETNIVGFDDEAKTLISSLTEESNRLKVITVVGMPGLGKTTMAWKIFKDPTIEFEYHTRIWVNITEDVDINKVLLTIQGNFTEPRHDMTVEQLIEDVKRHLEKSKFLIVMDDVWTESSWNRVKAFLPMSNNNGRVLITTRQTNLTAHAKQHMLKFLTPDESWELLQYEVYGKLEQVDNELKQVGQVIAQQCDGLPLSIIVIGGILADKRLKAKGSLLLMEKEWKDVSRSINAYLVHQDKGKRLEKIISLSYAKMPYELQGCFLYLGVFPEDAEISAKKLILLWIAEGLIQETDEEKSLEDIARDKLNDLIYRNLVMVDKEKLNREAKVCRVHDTIREFCKKEAAFDKQNVYQEIMYQEGVFKPPSEIIEKSCRRLCIHSHAYEFISSKPKALKARSFLSFPKRVINLEKGDMQYFTDAFRVLRVLDAENIKFPKFPPKLKQLFFLRYLTLAIATDAFKTLPKVIYDLKNLQTFVLDIPSRTVEITADVWKMKQMRHFKTKASIVVRNEGDGDGGENLQTLSRLAPESCTERVLKKARNLITLGIQGDLSTLEEFKCLEKLERLNKLKLVHDVYNTLGSEQPWRQLPEPNRFPPGLTILVLEGTCLDWSHMSTLGKLRCLEMLKLKDNAFKGNYWHATGDGFARLELLHIERADLISWAADDDAFPRLRSLYLKNCDKLKDIPLPLGKKLEVLYMERVTQYAVDSAKKIEQEKRASGHQEIFKLEIAPTDNK